MNEGKNVNTYTHTQKKKKVGSGKVVYLRGSEKHNVDFYLLPPSKPTN